MVSLKVTSDTLMNGASFVAIKVTLAIEVSLKNLSKTSNCTILLMFSRPSVGSSSVLMNVTVANTAA